MSESIYIIGHKSPDLDSVASAISYAWLKNKIEDTDKYKPAILGEINQETKYILDKFGFSQPEFIDSGKGIKMILVDHNEASQSIDDIEEGEVVEVLDHHKVNFSYGKPIPFCSIPWGATCSVIAKRFDKNNIEISPSMAGLMLSAILVDTVITKSPTHTPHDKEVIEALSSRANINDWQEFGIEIFKIRSSVSDLQARDIIEGDFKIFETGSGNVGIGQVETVDLEEFKSREEELIQELEKIRSNKEAHSMILFITDILKEGSLFLVASQDINKIEKAFNADFTDKKAYIDGIISRKKQVAPKIEETL